MTFNPHQWYLMRGSNYVGAPNTFIGGVASVISTPALLAAKLQNYPSGTAFSEFSIANFTIIGDDIECYIGVDYIVNSFRYTSITYYKDLGGYCKIVGDECFTGDSSMTMAIFPQAVELKAFVHLGWNFTNCTILELCYIPKATIIGLSNLDNIVFRNVKIGCKIYAEPTMATINSGGVEGDLAYAIASRSAIVSYVLNFTAPNPITNLSVGTVGATTIQLNFTAPTGSANAIDFYEAYANGIYKNKIVSGGNITGLTTGTSYEIEVIPRDIYYNGSSSNKVTQTTI